MTAPAPRRRRLAGLVPPGALRFAVAPPVAAAAGPAVRP